MKSWNWNEKAILFALNRVSKTIYTCVYISISKIKTKQILSISEGGEFPSPSPLPPLLILYLVLLLLLLHLLHLLRPRSTLEAKLPGPMFFMVLRSDPLEGTFPLFPGATSQEDFGEYSFPGG